MNKYLKYVPFAAAFFALLGFILISACYVFMIRVLGMNVNIHSLELIFDKDRYIQGCPNIAILVSWICSLVGLVIIALYATLSFTNKGSEKTRQILMFASMGLLIFSGIIGFFAKADYMAHYPKEEQQSMKALIEVPAGYVLGGVSSILSGVILLLLYSYNRFHKVESTQEN